MTRHKLQACRQKSVIQYPSRREDQFDPHFFFSGTLGNIAFKPLLHLRCYIKNSSSPLCVKWNFSDIADIIDTMRTKGHIYKVEHKNRNLAHFLLIGI